MGQVDEHEPAPPDWPTEVPSGEIGSHSSMAWSPLQQDFPQSQSVFQLTLAESAGCKTAAAQPDAEDLG